MWDHEVCPLIKETFGPRMTTTQYFTAQTKENCKLLKLLVSL